MGRIKTTATKSLANDLIKEHGNKFSEDFEKNKKVIDDVKPIQSKKMRNVIVGYITRRMKQINKSGL